MISSIKSGRSKWKWYQGLRLASQISYLGLVAASILAGNSVGTAVLAVLALVGGSFYCGWFCPLGAVQEWIGRLGHRLLKGRRLKIPESLEKYLQPMRYILMLAGFSGLVFLVFLDFLSLPYQNFMGLIVLNTAYVSVAAWSFLGLFLAAAILMDRPFCRYFCTEGARYGILSVLRIFSIRRQDSKCINCGVCDKKCPMQVCISHKSHVRNPQCINCMECIASCPVNGALVYGLAIPLKRKRGKNNEKN